MSHKSQRDSALLLDSLADMARAGDINEVFVVFRCRDGEHDYDAVSDDHDDLLFAVEGSKIRHRKWVARNG